jgi:hypothetical protein
LSEKIDGRQRAKLSSPIERLREILFEQSSQSIGQSSPVINQSPAILDQQTYLAR